MFLPEAVKLYWENIHILDFYFMIATQNYQESFKTSIKLDEGHQNSGDIFKMFKKTFVALRVLYYVKLYDAEKTKPHNYKLTTKLGRVQV